MDQKRRDHVAMISIPAHGHVNPSLAVIRELVDRGHRVTYAISEAFAPQVAAAGAVPVTYPTTLGEPKPDRSGSEDLVELLGIFLREAEAALPTLLESYEDDRPDLVLYDVAAFAGPALAARWGVPAVQLSPTYVAWEGHERETGVAAAVAASPFAAEVFPKFAKWLADNGIERPVAEFINDPEQGLVLVPRVLQPHADRVSEKFTFAGPCFGDRSHQGTWEAPGDGRPVLLVSLGTVYNNHVDFFRQCVAAFGDLDWHVVLSVGNTLSPADLGPLPPNVEAHSSVPQMSVLAQATAFVTHAGMGSTAEGLYWGVPMVAVPQALDQHVNAARIADLGVGRHIPREQATAEALRDAVVAVASDPEVLRRCAEVREEVRSGGGTAKAADFVESCLPAREAH
ncbi:macrolide family glycosyltransferase [Streptoalloteichus hindustanus]|uniref:Glycosyltransferase, MGT family n=1 Tax=Streptoalloteichus hindustanus TaxID=2017 RepID=A0A1M5ET44_STRHI|nr:macrolide family glycosyltransferase [Streptoalloteichus hindustanus]SHF82334.1 glycosyltransferase, MGT family [Streptoalloteichus hindustanus]